MAAKNAYANAGVDISAANRTVALIRKAVQGTHGPEVLAGVGAFGGLFDAALLRDARAPVLVSSVDGVGTKTKIAAELGRYDTIGRDLVNHCVNDILCQGARPLFFMDYVASANLQPEMVAAVVRGLAEACRQAGCALLGGETAEMPGIYLPDEFDLAGAIVGWVERDEAVDGSDVRPGDALIGLASSGPHTNGYSLIRQVFAGVPLDRLYPELDRPLGDVLLEPHRCYLHDVQRLRDVVRVKGMAHITGGGLVENPPRALPAGLRAAFDWGSWPIPPIFSLIQRLGNIDDQEMRRVFNLGLGMVLVVAPEDAGRALETLGIGAWMVGRVEREA
ncbi:MAG: phosphoribosylformylglycinamidine cyclo-ligase [Chloroflexi bacterium]|nr:phosphoribosylformylglycinamidine cyclo-ligase [Chloroflexota bacterium]